MTKQEIVVTQKPNLVIYRTVEDRNPARLYLQRLSPGSRPTMESALNYMAGLMLEGATLDDVPWHWLRYEHTAWLRNQLINRQIKITRRHNKNLRKDNPDAEDETQLQSATTTNRMLTALRQTLKEAWKLGDLNTDDYHRAIAIDNAPEEHGPDIGGMLTIGEMISFFAACNDGTKAGARDAAMFAVAAGGGLRRAEVSSLNLGDYNRETGAILVRRGKRNKTRLVPMPAGSATALDYWITIRGQDSGTLFPHVDKADHIYMRRLSPQSVQLIFDKRAETANITAFTPHDLRRTYISMLLDGGTDIATVQRLAGHSNINTTTRYDKRGERAMFAAAKTLHVPFIKPK